MLPPKFFTSWTRSINHNDNYTLWPVFYFLSSTLWDPVFSFNYLKQIPFLSLYLHNHSAPTGARNSSLGHPNMAEASLGKNFPKMIPSLLRVFNGWYLQGLVIWCVSLSRPQNFWWKRRHIARRGCDISSRDARISTFVQLLDALNSFQGCPRLIKDARISPTSSLIDAKVSKENYPSDII